MPTRSYLRFLPLVSLVALMGFGCKQPTRIVTQNPWNTTIVTTTPAGQTDATSTEPLDGRKPPSPPLSGGDMTKGTVSYLNSVLDRVNKATSFRARLVIPEQEGTTSGNMEFAAGKGMHGWLQVPGPHTIEISVMNARTYFRTNASTWDDLTGTADADAAAKSLQATFALNPSHPGEPLPEGTKILGISDDESGCKRYVFLTPETKNAADATTICIANDYPTYLSAVTPYGNMEIRYRDFNQAVVIEGPK